jgi:zinc/manganese transport system substrate-binding protein
MRKKLVVCVAWLLGALGKSPRSFAELKVVATVPDLAALAREVGGDRVSVKALSLPTQDPHFVDAKPHLALELNRAQLLLLVGVELEIGWLPTLIAGARNASIQPGARGHLDCAPFIHLLEVPAHPVDRSMGDIHPGGNPHYLLDPRAAASVARGIAARMAELDPPHASDYRQNLASFSRRLEAARKGWELTMARDRGAAIVEYHRTLVYLADWLGLEVVGSLEPKPGIPPNPAHVAELLGQARARGVRAIVQEERYPAAASRLLAEKIPAPVVGIPGGTNLQGGQSYLQFLDEVVRRLHAGLAAGERR